MTAHELAKVLFDGPDLMVTVRAYEGGVNEIESVSKPTAIHLKSHSDSEWYYGRHEYHNADCCVHCSWDEPVTPPDLAIHIS